MKNPFWPNEESEGTDKCFNNMQHKKMKRVAKNDLNMT